MIRLAAVTLALMLGGCAAVPKPQIAAVVPLSPYEIQRLKFCRYVISMYRLNSPYCQLYMMRGTHVMTWKVRR